MIALAIFAFAGCGDGDDSEGESTSPPPAADTTNAAEGTESATGGGGSNEDGVPGTADGPANGTEVVLGDSEFGEMLYDANDQAIYVFERDANTKSVCYGECAAAWPPVVTSDQPAAGPGVDAGLLGTTERRDGTLQVTYGARPLYYYAHEAPGEVRCHNVDLNGGLWWVVGANGKPLA